MVVVVVVVVIVVVVIVIVVVVEVWDLRGSLVRGQLGPVTKNTFDCILTYRKSSCTNIF